MRALRCLFLGILCLFSVSAYAQPVSPYGEVQCDATANYTASVQQLTELVALNASARIYVCGYVFNTGATASSVGLSRGTGTNCGTGTAALVSPLIMPANTTIVVQNIKGLVVPAGQALCLNVATGTTPPIVASVQYFQHPGS